MAHHKRRRPKNRRAGCLMCKSWKVNGACPRHLDMAVSDRRRHEAGREQLRCEMVGRSDPN